MSNIKTLYGVAKAVRAQFVWDKKSANKWQNVNFSAAHTSVNKEIGIHVFVALSLEYEISQCSAAIYLEISDKKYTNILNRIERIKNDGSCDWEPSDVEIFYRKLALARNCFTACFS